MNDEVRLNHFFSVLREKRKAFADNYAYFSPQLAPRFNSFKFISPDEMKLSEILAMLLNPQCDHAQDDLFLKLFFSEIFSETDINYPNNACNIKVGCEVYTDRLDTQSRRIDIEVNFDDCFGLAIENKPWAFDQIQQLSDYAKQMQYKFGKDWCLIYLSGNDSNPSENSATPALLKTWEENNQYKKINFGQIVDWLKKCEAQCQADHVRHFLRDFIGYCKNEFLGEIDMVDANLVKGFALLNSENLELALVVGQQMISIKEALLNKFLQDLNTEVKDSLAGWKFEYPNNFGYWSKHLPIKFYKPEWKNYYLAIEFDKNECIQFFQCIRTKDDKTPDLPDDTLKRLNNALNKTGYKSLPMWPWYCYFSSPYYDWRKNIEPWLEIHSGKLSGKVIAEIKKLVEASEEIIDIAEKSLNSCQ
jgi:hypothetical protein